MSIDSLHPKEFWRCPGQRLVYARSLKCASTFFSNIFAANGWTKQTRDQVDYDHDHVFSFMSEPTHRHVKGLVEDSINLGIEKDLLGFNRQLLHSIPWLGEHSIPLSLYWGDQFDRIEWIMIEKDSLHHELRVQQMCQSLGVDIDFGIEVYCNESDDYELEIFQKVYKTCGPFKPLIGQISRDYEKYQILQQQCRERPLRKPD